MASKKKRSPSARKPKEEVALIKVAAEAATGSSIAEAARMHGVSPATARHYARSKEGRAMMHEIAVEIRREAVDLAKSRLEAASGKAIDTLFDVMENGSRDADRLKAALGLLDRVGIPAKREVSHSHDTSQMTDKQLADQLPEALRVLREESIKKMVAKETIEAVGQELLPAGDVDSDPG